MVDYNPNIPQGTDNISTSQGQLLNNFGQLDTIFANDHYTWDDITTANRGYHKQVFFPSTRAAPTVSGTQSMIYSKTISGVAEPYFTNSSADNVMWRGGSSSGVVTPTLNSGLGNGKIVFPNFTIQWGYAASVSDGNTISFPAAFTTKCSHVNICGQRSNTQERSLWVQSFNSTGFVVRTDSGGIGVLWIAIGD